MIFFMVVNCCFAYTFNFAVLLYYNMSSEDIKAWQKARQLNIGIYKATTKDLFSRDFALRDQIRRSSISVLSNIAEGFERESKQEFIRFLSIAKASCGELRAQLYIANDLRYLSKEEFELL